MNKFLALVPLFLLLKINKTAACPADEYCTKCDGTKCETCIDSYPNADGICTAPETTIDHCMGYSDKETCDRCYFGYDFNNTTKKCEEVDIDDCVYEENNKCIVCEEKVPDADGKCTKDATIDNCEYLGDILDVETCFRCDEGYAVKTNKCVANDGCEALSADDKCSSCFEGYYHTGDDCKKSSVQSSSSLISQIFFSLLLVFIW